MALHIFLADCMVCRKELGLMRDKHKIDQVDEDGAPQWSYLLYQLPPARLRDKIAPGLCDGCWSEHRLSIIGSSRRYREHRMPPPFHQNLLWMWVADKLAEEAKALGQERQRLSVHLEQKADEARGVVRVGPLREYGPRRFVYKKGRIYG